jgi:BTB/POZ domain
MFDLPSQQAPVASHSKSLGAFEHLSWRMSPSLSYSDWTIEILRTVGDESSSNKDPEGTKRESSSTSTAESSAQQQQQQRQYPPQEKQPEKHPLLQKQQASLLLLRTDRYHVHRSVLAVGPRHSEYFAAQFQLQMHENVTCTSRIALEDDSRANVFPLLLDFVYAQEDAQVTQIQIELNAEKAAALYHLAEYFDIPRLREMVEDYYRNHLQMINLVEYISAAQRHAAPSLLDIAVEKSVEQLLEMDPRTARQLEPLFLLQILESNQALGERLYGFHASQLVVECALGEHRHKLTKDLFYQLTDKELLPYMESKAAVHLLSLDAMFTSAAETAEATVESEAKQEKQQKEPASYVGGDAYPTSTTRALTCLQKRCTQSISDKWKHIRNQAANSGELSRALAQAPSHVLVDILMRATSEIGLRGTCSNVRPTTTTTPESGIEGRMYCLFLITLSISYCLL